MKVLTGRLPSTVVSSSRPPPSKTVQGEAVGSRLAVRNGYIEKAKQDIRTYAEVSGSLAGCYAHDIDNRILLVEQNSYRETPLFHERASGDRSRIEGGSSSSNSLKNRPAREAVEGEGGARATACGMAGARLAGSQCSCRGRNFRRVMVRSVGKCRWQTQQDQAMWRCRGGVAQSRQAVSPRWHRGNACCREDLGSTCRRSEAPHQVQWHQLQALPKHSQKKWRMGKSQRVSCQPYTSLAPGSGEGRISPSAVRVTVGETSSGVSCSCEARNKRMTAECFGLGAQKEDQRPVGRKQARWAAEFAARRGLQSG